LADSSDLDIDKAHPADAGKGESALHRQAVDDAYGARQAVSLQRTDLVQPAKGTTDNAVDLMSGFTDGAIFAPGRAVQQLFGASEVQAAPQAAKSSSEKTGQLIGSFVPFVGMVTLTRGASAEFFGQCCTPPLARFMTEQATAGFLTGSLLTPTDLNPGETLLDKRLNQGKLTAATFSSMTGISAHLDHNLPKPESNELLPQIARRVTISVISGTVGSFVDGSGRTSFGASQEDSLSQTVIESLTKARKEPMQSKVSFDNLLPDLRAIVPSKTSSEGLSTDAKLVQPPPPVPKSKTEDAGAEKNQQS
jgi:hypothetical protein